MRTGLIAKKTWNVPHFRSRRNACPGNGFEC